MTEQPWSDIDLSAERSLLSTHDLRALGHRIEQARERWWLWRGSAMGAAAASIVWLAAWPLVGAWFPSHDPPPAAPIKTVAVAVEVAAPPAVVALLPPPPAVPPACQTQQPAVTAKRVREDREHREVTEVPAPAVATTTPSSSAVDTSESRLKVYLSLHERAQAALARGDHNEAVQQARALRQRYPDGALFSEAVVIEARALAKGKHSEELSALLHELRGHPRLADKWRVLEQLAPTPIDDGDQ